MGDYRYFPEQPGPARGHDPYARPVASERGRPADHAAPRGYVPPRPQRAAPLYSDPYTQGDDPAGYEDDLPPFDPYMQPRSAPHSVPRGAPYVPPMTPTAGYAPAPYGERAYAAPPPPHAAPPQAAMRAPVYADPYGAPYAPPPSWVGPQGAAAGPQAAPARPPMRPAAVLHGLGAVMSLGLVVLAGAWTWNMMQRDVSGVPVVRALEGPMRVAPDNPGGQQAAFQGLAINELAGSGAATEADVIVLAPAPVGLGEITPPDATLPQPDALGLAGDPLPSGPALGFLNPNRFAVERSPRPRGREGAGTQLAAVQIMPPASQMPALSTSNDPRAADTLAASIAQSVALDLDGPRGIDVDPASIGPGTRLVQLGAYDNPEEARAAWDGLSNRFSPLLNDRGRVIEAAHSGGSVFFRLRAHGFSDERDARRFCAALVAEQIDCIPVLVR